MTRSKKNNGEARVDGSTNRVLSGMVAGFVASAVSGLLIIIISALAIFQDFDIIIIQGSMFGFAQTIIAAWILYFTIGIFIWGSLYALVEPLMGFKTHMVKGFLFGILTWFIAMIIIMPLSGAGFFASTYEVITAIMILILDLVFGLTLGYSYMRSINQPVNK